MKAAWSGAPGQGSVSWTSVSVSTGSSVSVGSPGQPVAKPSEASSSHRLNGVDGVFMKVSFSVALEQASGERSRPCWPRARLVVRCRRARRVNGLNPHSVPSANKRSACPGRNHTHFEPRPRQHIWRPHNAASRAGNDRQRSRCPRTQRHSCEESRGTATPNCTGLPGGSEHTFPDPAPRDTDRCPGHLCPSRRAARCRWARRGSRWPSPARRAAAIAKPRLQSSSSESSQWPWKSGGRTVTVPYWPRAPPVARCPSVGRDRESGGHPRPRRRSAERPGPPRRRKP